MKLDPEEFDDMILLPWSYPWWKRIPCALVWRTPFKYLAGLRWKNPYCCVVGIKRVTLSRRNNSPLMRKITSESSPNAGN